MCASNIGNNHAQTVGFLNQKSDVLVTAGRYHLRVWTFKRSNRKMQVEDVNVLNLKRFYNCIYIDENDEYLYAGTDTGDLLQVHLTGERFKYKVSFPLASHCKNLTECSGSNPVPRAKMPCSARASQPLHAPSAAT